MKCKYCNKDTELSGKYCSKSCGNMARRLAIKTMLVNYAGGKCQCCGYNKLVGALEFHHIDESSKDFAMSDAQHIAIELIREELDKCVLVCSNCHREIHKSVTICPKINTEERLSMEYLFDKKQSPAKQKKILARKQCLTPSCNGVAFDKHGSCRKCAGRRIHKEVGNWPTYDVLLDMVFKMPTTRIAEIVGVSDVAVAKRLKKTRYKEAAARILGKACIRYYE